MTPWAESTWRPESMGKVMTVDGVKWRNTGFYCSSLTSHHRQGRSKQCSQVIWPNFISQITNIQACAGQCSPVWKCIFTPENNRLRGCQTTWNPQCCFGPVMKCVSLGACTWCTNNWPATLHTTYAIKLWLGIFTLPVARDFNFA